MDYAFLQQYWWFLVSLLGALLVFLLFVQGGQTFIFAARRDEPLQLSLIHILWQLQATQPRAGT